MSRRKQARPIRLLEDEENEAAAAVAVVAAASTVSAAAVAVASSSFPSTATSSIIGADLSINHHHGPLAELPQVLMCPRCQEQFTVPQEYLTHKAECDKKALKHGDTAHSDPEDMVVSEDDEEDDAEELTEGKRLERMRRHRQDAANNNSVDDENSPSAAAAADEENRIDDDDGSFAAPSSGAAASRPGHVTLEALQNTKVAVAQFAATAMANNVDNETALQELAVLQSTLFTLQHQQILQVQLINQLQHQLQLDRTKDDEQQSGTTSDDNEAEHNHSSSIAPSNSSSVKMMDSPISSPHSLPPPPPPPPPPAPPLLPSSLTPPPKLEMNHHHHQAPLHMQPPMCSISQSLASTIITHGNDPPTMEEPNTLEMLQKRAQEVLDNASQGLLATNLADELAFRKSKGSMSPYDSKGRNEPFFKHRCRYCGKVFGSDSALQIHIRSHTGERPYKCNVCGSRFTTKGNLKVHFQRHSSKFPHIKMNPNPVPEHLDKYHPPLLAQLGQQQALSPGGPSQSHPPSHLGFSSGPPPFPPTSLPLYRPPIIPPPPELLNSRLMEPNTPQQRLFNPHPLFIKREEQETPADLRKPTQRSPSPPEEKMDIMEKDESPPPPSPVPAPAPIIPPTIVKEKEIECKEEPQEPSPSVEPENLEPFFDECSNESRFSNEEEEQIISPEIQDEPENLSSSRSNIMSTALCISTGQRLPANFTFGHHHHHRHQSSPPSSTSSTGSLGHYPLNPLADITKDPAIYTNLLPRPGSNDNSWESLIEVTKTSETSKLQQLVDNIEHKLSDPNQCVICHRVLSCKSALQMHYRTHTGERPFKCKICGRAFTTKGNLKTHMSVHRAKPPMRVLHQCPVCHKKFTNALVLQQHIRLHTGEPTDLTPEQIQAAEVKEFPSPGGFPPGLPHPFLGQGFSVPGLSPLTAGMHFPLRFDGQSLEQDGLSMDDDDDVDDDDDNDCMSIDMDQNMDPFSISPSSGNLLAINSSQQFNEMNCLSSEELNSHVLPSTRTPPLPPPNNLIMQNGDDEKSPNNNNRSVTSRESAESHNNNNRLTTTPVHQQIPRPPSSQAAASPTPSECNSMGALDLTPKQSNNNNNNNNQNLPIIPTSSASPPPPPPSIFSAFGLMPSISSQSSTPLMTSALSSLTSSVLTSTSFSPLRLAVGPGATLGRGNTTCNLCFKTFACHSALEIHYRSHTKERPFKCTVCDRGFSTKGNMKQHMLTHKIRDMPHHMFENNKTASLSGEDSTPLPPSLPPSREHSNDAESSPIMMLTNAANALSTQHHHQPPPPPPPPPSQPPQSSPSSHQIIIPPQSSSVSEVQMKLEPPPNMVKREPTESEIPLPKRPPSLQSSKHLCHVCNKNFSSSSALQIHMRTHTGDKPFRCTVCQKAFTTKGNLKVHMGTHMWSNGASRRGRRMSLDLPPIPMTPKDSEFLQRRPDLFYPYLPAPFLNGMQQKLNEMSSSLGPPQNGLTPSPTKYGGLLGFGYPPPEGLSRPQLNSPERASDRPPSEPEPSRPSAALWDLHFERKSADAPREDILSASREGLAA